jgi:hypothetical protein
MIEHAGGFLSSSPFSSESDTALGLRRRVDVPGDLGTTECRENLSMPHHEIASFQLLAHGYKPGQSKCRRGGRGGHGSVRYETGSKYHVNWVERDAP